MIALTLAQMRRSLPRLAAAGLAIVLGTAFVAATLLTGNVITRTSRDAVTARFAEAQLVVQAPSGTWLTLDQVAQIETMPQVTAASPLLYGYLTVTAGGRSSGVSVLPTTTDPGLSPLTVTQGTAPTSDDEVALPVEVAQRLGVDVGGTVTATDAYGDAEDQAGRTLTVTGIVEDPAGAYAQWGGVALGTPAATTAWAGGADASVDAVLVAVDGDEAAAQKALTAELSGVAEVRTRDQAADDALAELTDGGNGVVGVVLGFAAVALLVAGLVIANTFQVLVAHRTRTLALLRCVGARRAQLRASVLLEGTLVGLAASALGLLAGLGLGQAALAVLGRMDLGVRLPSVVPVSISVIVLPLLIGTAVTVVASLVPARAATRVRPVAALRPQDGPVAGERVGRIRLAASVLLSVAGLVLVVGAALAARSQSGTYSMALLGAGLLGGAVSFVGLLLGAVLWVPAAMGAAGRLVGRAGPAARLAAANTTRNPRRTAATSTALLIGVTLVVTMSTGAASARRSLDAELDRQFPVDLVAESYGTDEGPVALSPGAATRIGSVDGIGEMAQVRSADLQIAGVSRTVYAVSVEDARALLHDQGLADALAAGQLVVPASLAKSGVDVTVSSSSDPTGLGLVTHASDANVVITTPQVLDALAPDAPVTAVWASVTGADPAQVLQDVLDEIGDEPVSVSSAAAERAQYETIIDTLLAIVVGLLAVAVVIALIGVTNTLSLSVLERRRESATLRAVGLTRRQLRGTLAVEGALIAVVGAVLGIVLGLLYGWAGATIVFGSAAQTQLAVPWADLATVLAVALLAGLLASVLPARSAVRTPPVAALAVD